jgi:hypothetical protein
LARKKDRASRRD